MNKLQRWSVGIDLEKGFYQRHDDDGHWVEYDKAADLIEQLQQRNAELEAHVERMRIAALNAISIMPSGQAKADLRDAYDDTPQQSLNALKREVAREAFVAGYLRGFGYNGENRSAHYAEHYANTKYSTEGE